MRAAIVKQGGGLAIANVPTPSPKPEQWVGLRSRLPVDRTFPLAQANEALEHMRNRRHLGKIVLVT